MPSVILVSSQYSSIWWWIDLIAEGNNLFLSDARQYKIDYEAERKKSDFFCNIWTEIQLIKEILQVNIL